MRRFRPLILAAAAATCTLPVHAQFVPDALNDFIPIYPGVYNASLDVLFAYGTWTPASQTFTIGAVMAGPAGAFICSECVELCLTGLGRASKAVAPPPPMTGFELPAQRLV